ncbi:mismatch-specific DNA-glycosylase [Pseudoclavibacter soli]|uniref:mismatch-specific DNA-glycosylase n=1 Tax=Pseudoclavibacter soli TaxID=452623 RepID=UPI0003F672E8|nr:mismatch-specific DNA-glycosylase [Pseudoclavibacter soli]
MRFTRAQLQAFRNCTVDDIIGPGTRLLFVGVNPGLWTAAVNTPYAYPGNRFWPALMRSGLAPDGWTPGVFDASQGLTAVQRGQFIAAGLGSTNFVNRATARADELSRDELEAGGARLQGLVGELRPAVVAILGVMAYRDAFGRPKARMGRQPEPLAGVPVWVLPNPSGLNAHETIDSIAAKMRAVGEAAGLL